MSAGCISTTAEGTFTSGRDAIQCDGVWPVCKGRYAGCVLDEYNYVEGTFPGARKFIVDTPPGDWLIRISIFFTQRQSPGTETSVTWSEPGCADQYQYKSTLDTRVGDLFEKAGRDQVLDIEQAVAETGDHLVEILSDATCRYALKVELKRKESAVDD